MYHSLLKLTFFMPERIQFKTVTLCLNISDYSLNTNLNVFININYRQYIVKLMF